MNEVNTATNIVNENVFYGGLELYNQPASEAAHLIRRLLIWQCMSYLQED